MSFVRAITLGSPKTKSTAGCAGCWCSDELYGDAEGSHATPSEVSLSWYAHPEAVKDVVMSPELAPKGAIRDAADYRRQFPDGRIGSNPGLASVAHGQRILEAAVGDTLEDFNRFIQTNTSH